MQKNTKNPYFGGSGSFKIIDVDANKKLVTSVCYIQQFVCVCLQLFYATRAISTRKITTFRR